jgi:RNA polymerase sigma factor (sigma-70 family)
MINSIASSLPLDYLPSIPLVNILLFKKVHEKHQKNNYTDTAILDGIRIRDMRVINYLYENFFAQISNMVRLNSGNKMDAEDLFQEALIAIFQKISKGGLELMSSFNTYLYSICWHMWLQKLNKRPFKYEYKGLSDQDAEEDEKKMKEIVEESEKYSLFQEHFLKLSLAEQKVLRLYLDKTSSKDVARIMGYKSGNYAKFRKYICKERLKNSIVNDPRYLKLSQS